MTVPQAAITIERRMIDSLETAIVVAKPKGLDLPWIKRVGDSEMPLNVLGPLLTRAVASDGPAFRDIRSLFPNPGPEIAVNMLCEAVSSLVQDGILAMYVTTDDDGRELYLMNLSTCDAWVTPLPEGGAPGGPAAGLLGIERMSECATNGTGSLRKPDGVGGRGTFPSPPPPDEPGRADEVVQITYELPPRFGANSPPSPVDPSRAMVARPETICSVGQYRLLPILDLTI